jgi:hypothetical protein
MPIDNANDLNDLELKLRQVLDCVMQKARSDADFAQQLQTIFRAPSVSELEASSEGLKELNAKHEETSKSYQSTGSETQSNTQKNTQINAVSQDVGTPKATVKTRTTKSRKQPFNAVEHLHNFGVDELRKHLDEMTNTELVQVLRAQGSKKGKAKNPERTKIIEEVIAIATRKLNQGSVFLKS